MEVFVYGTLTDPDRARTALDESGVGTDSSGSGSGFEYGPTAVLEGLDRAEGQYPTLVPPDGDRDTARVEGRIFRVADDRIAALDRYEGVDRGLYARVPVPRADGGSVETYVGDPSTLGLETGWPGEGAFEDRVRRYVSDREVVVRIQ